MTTTLFALTGEALTLQSRINNAAELLFSDDPAEVAEATAELEALINAEADNRKAVEAKADAWCWAIDHIRAQAASRAEHARRLTELAKAAEHQAEVLQDRLIGALQRVAPDETTWALPEHKITSRRSTVVELDPELLPVDLPEQFQRVKTVYSADKTALAAALKAGATIDGAQLVERRSWTIR
jgi:DNA repair exonuclease SbcCD ATPase subunit